MEHNDIQQLIQSLDTFHEVRAVNNLIQGICERSARNELGSSETLGLAVVLGWQNEKIMAVEGVVRSILDKKTLGRERCN